MPHQDRVGTETYCGQIEHAARVGTAGTLDWQDTYRWITERPLILRTALEPVTGFVSMPRRV